MDPDVFQAGNEGLKIFVGDVGQLFPLILGKLPQLLQIAQVGIQGVGGDCLLQLQIHLVPADHLVAVLHCIHLCMSVSNKILTFAEE